jgi:hypothetical protein
MGAPAAPEPRAPAGLAGCAEHDYAYGVYDEDFPTRQGPVPDYGAGDSTELLCSGGPWGRAAPFRSRRSEGDTPRPRRRSSRAIFRLTLGWLTKDSMPATTRDPMSFRSGCKGRSRRSSLPTHPKGDCETRRRVFPSGFHHHVEDYGPSHNFFNNSHRMWRSIGNRGTTADRDRRWGGGIMGTHG